MLSCALSCSLLLVPESVNTILFVLLFLLSSYKASVAAVELLVELHHLSQSLRGHDTNVGVALSMLV